MDKFFDAVRGIDIRRRTDDKWIGGVCSGLADRLGVDPVIVRAALVVLAVFGGAGITIYLVAWVLLPNDREEIVAQRALRDGDGGPVVLLVFAALALLGGSWWSHDSSWGFPWFIVPLGLFVWWLTNRHNDPDADQRVNAQRLGTPVPAGPSPTTAGPTATTSGPGPAAAGQAAPMTRVIPRTPAAPKKLGRRSGGPLMGLVAIGLAVATYGSLIWAGNAFSWTGSHTAIALAGSLAAIGLTSVVLGVAGWRAGFVAFLAVVLAVSAWTSSVIPAGIHVNGRVGDATWKPTSVTATANNDNYRLGLGNGVLDLSGLPTEGIGPATIPVSVGIGDLRVLVPPGLTVKVVGHVNLGEILLPGDPSNNGQGGSDVSRSVVIGDGPTEVVVNAGVGIGQLTVVKE